MKGKGMFFSDRCQFCHDFGEKVESYLCSDCKERIQKLGYVKLAENQGLPLVNPGSAGGYSLTSFGKECQQDMLEAGWRKVVEVKDGG